MDIEKKFEEACKRIGTFIKRKDALICETFIGDLALIPKDRKVLFEDTFENEGFGIDAIRGKIENVTDIDVKEVVFEDITHYDNWGRPYHPSAHIVTIRNDRGEELVLDRSKDIVKLPNAEIEY